MRRDALSKGAGTRASAWVRHRSLTVISARSARRQVGSITLTDSAPIETTVPTATAVPQHIADEYPFLSESRPTTFKARWGVSMGKRVGIIPNLIIMVSGACTDDGRGRYLSSPASTPSERWENVQSGVSWLFSIEQTDHLQPCIRTRSIRFSITGTLSDFRGPPGERACHRHLRAERQDGRY